MGEADGTIIYPRCDETEADDFLACLQDVIFDEFIHERKTV